MHAKTITESKGIGHFKIYAFEYYGETIPHGFMYLFRVRCLGYALQVYNEKRTVEQIEMLLKNIWFYTSISHLIFQRYNLLLLLLLTTAPTTVIVIVFVLRIFQSFQSTWNIVLSSFAMEQLSNQAVEGILSLGDSTSSFKRLVFYSVGWCPWVLFVFKYRPFICWYWTQDKRANSYIKCAIYCLGLSTELLKLYMFFIIS